MSQLKITKNYFFKWIILLMCNSVLSNPMFVNSHNSENWIFSGAFAGQEASLKAFKQIAEYLLPHGFYFPAVNATSTGIAASWKSGKPGTVYALASPGRTNRHIVNRSNNYDSYNSHSYNTGYSSSYNNQQTYKSYPPRTSPRQNPRQSGLSSKQNFPKKNYYQTSVKPSYYNSSTYRFYNTQSPRNNSRSLSNLYKNRLYKDNINSSHNSVPYSREFKEPDRAIGIHK